ncbi:MAG: type II secretion system protein J [Gemmatimonadota bacterium]
MSAQRAGFTTLELLVAATVGLLVTGAALALCAAGNRAVARLTAAQSRWQELRAAATVWQGEWRGAGYDPTGAAASGVTRLAAETLEFSADWNGNGTLLPTGSNPNERLAWAAAAGVWRRGVNGGPRLPAAWPDSLRFYFRGGEGEELGPGPRAALVRYTVARAVVVGSRGTAPVVVEWGAARRNPPPP